MKTHFLAKTRTSWLMASSFLCLTSVAAFGQTTQSSVDIKQETTENSGGDTSTNANLSLVRVKGKTNP